MARLFRVKVFLGTAIPFGIAIAIPRVGRLSLPYVVGIGVITGALFGGVMVWWTSRSVRRLTAEGIDPGTMDPAQERSIEVVGDLATVYQSCRCALLKLKKLKLVKENPVTGELDAKTGVSWQSFGEVISVRITGDGPNATVHISSKPRLSTSTVDLGKGVENVALFVRYLLSEVPAAAPNNRWRGP